MSQIKKIFPKEEIVLGLLRAGKILSAFFDNPHSVRGVLNAAYSYSQEWDDYSPCRLKLTVNRLKQKNLIKIVKNKNNNIYQLTGAGIKKYLYFEIRDLKINIPKKWDNKWRMVIFDIPNFKKKSRDLFHKKLKQVGFYFIQESVALFPYPCQKEIKYLSEVLEIKQHVNTFRIDYCENEEIIKSKFNM